MELNSEKINLNGVLGSSFSDNSESNNFLGKKTKSHLFVTLNSNNIVNIPNCNYPPKTIKNSTDNTITTFCPLCHKNYSTKYKLRDHMLSKHLNISLSKSLTSNNKNNTEISNLTLYNKPNNNTSEKKLITNSNNNCNLVNNPNHIPFNLISLTKQVFTSIIKGSTTCSYQDYILFENLCLGKGILGSVYFGINSKTFIPVAIKIQNSGLQTNYLLPEIDVLLSLKNNNRFPQYFLSDYINEKYILVESLFGPNLKSLLDLCDGHFDIITVCLIGIELLNLLETLHLKGYLYVDLKEDNVCIILGDASNKNITNDIALVDFGHCCKFTDKENKHLTPKKSRKRYGNICNSSINSLSGNSISRRDDIESLCYFLLNLWKKDLPWSNLNYNNTIELIEKSKGEKMKYDFNKECGMEFEELALIYKLSKRLNFTDEPDYKVYNILLNNCIKRNSTSPLQYNNYKWEKIFCSIFEESLEYKNKKKLDEVIKTTFKGFPYEIAYQYIYQFYINKNK